MGHVNLGLCPYCRSDQIISVESGFNDGHMRSGIAVSAFRRVEFARLICLQCGSVREWVANQEDLDLLRTRYGQTQS